MKLQQAYISESTAMGNWGIIGYKGPGAEITANATTGGATSETTNFTYKDGTGFTDNTVALSASGKAGFTAANRVKLNDCPTGDNWTVTVKSNGTVAGEATFAAAILSTNLTACTPLTPNFDKIGK